MGKGLNLNVSAGGIFSKFSFVLQTIGEIDPDFDEAYINNIDERSLVGDNNIFNCIFDQKIIHDSETHECFYIHNYSKFLPIEESVKIDEYKKIVRKLKFTNELKKEIEFYSNSLGIDDNFLGVHIRLCDMNIYYAGDYGILHFDDFLDAIKKNKSHNTKIFVASDNKESIIKLKNEFGDDIYFIEEFIRGETETEDTLKLQIDNFGDKKLWMEAFIEMILLSKCGTLICRTSNLNNASIVYSDSIKKIIRL